MRIFDEASQKNDSGLDRKWQATRLEVELPLSSASSVKKNIVPELVNQRFMWVDDYFHYGDWEQRMRDVYDCFNLTVLPRPQGETKFYFDKQNNKRIIPQGIFPPPHGKRVIHHPSVTEQFDSHTEMGADAINKFEKQPYKSMVAKELERSAGLAKMSSEMSMITNLQNIKHGLKRDYSDKEITDMLLKNLNFTDRLINQHLHKNDKETANSNPSYVKRDAASFREFVKDTYFSKDQEDPFTHFYLKESGKIERIHKTYDEHKNKYAELARDAPNE